MKCVITLFILVLVVGLTRSDSQGAQPMTRAAEKSNCLHNLNLIYDAIQKYRRENKELPNWLSDLYPKYLPDDRVLICQAALRGGQLGKQKDRSTTYTYEFNLRPPPGTNNPPGRTQRDWKRMQMALVGGVVPIVRCEGGHELRLNLGFDGKIYESKLHWEDNYADLIKREDLLNPPWFSPRVIFYPIKIPPRPAGATARQVDLTDHYNAVLTKPWLPGNLEEPTRDLKGLKPGMTTLAKVPFDVRGIIQLSSAALVDSGAPFPAEVTNIVVGVPCRRLYLLVGASQGKANEAAATIWVHFGDGKKREQVLRIGKHLQPAWEGKEEILQFGEAVWRDGEKGPTLYMIPYDNPPGTLIRSLDFRSNMTGADLFILGITAEP